VISFYVGSDFHRLVSGATSARIGAAVRITGVDGFTLIVEPVSPALEAPREVNAWKF
jgi:hypothetical protein